MSNENSEVNAFLTDRRSIYFLSDTMSQHLLPIAHAAVNSSIALHSPHELLDHSGGSGTHESVYNNELTS